MPTPAPHLSSWPSSPRGARFLPSLLAALSLLGACAVEDKPIAELPFGSCACQQTDPPSCPVDVCDLELEIEASSCQGKVNLVEIMIGDKLEKHIWTPGVPARTCTTLKRGETLVVVARADTAWTWKPEITCPAKGPTSEKKGPTIARMLQCVASE